MLALRLVLEGACSFRCAAKVLAIFASYMGDSKPTPSHTAIRMWLLRVGLNALKRPLDRTVSWVWLIDHTIQIGSMKALVILGCPIGAVPFGERAFRLADLHLVALVPMEKSNGDLVKAELDVATKRTGVPSQIVSDQGSDLCKGIADYQKSHPETSAILDIAHYGANVLEHAWEDQPRWQEFNAKLQGSASKLRQNKAAYLLPPRMRDKSRFMNVDRLLKFASRVLAHLDGATPNEKAVENYSWLRDYRMDLSIWMREHSMVEAAKDQLRVDGLHAGTEAALKEKWGRIDARESTVGIATKLLDYVAKYRPTKADGRHVASTEIVESSFGKLKWIEGDQSQSGLTRLVLSMGVIVGSPTEATTQEALDATPEKNVDTWAKKMIGKTVQWFRRQLLGTSHENGETKA